MSDAQTRMHAQVTVTCKLQSRPPACSSSLNFELDHVLLLQAASCRCKATSYKPTAARKLQVQSYTLQASAVASSSNSRCCTRLRQQLLRSPRTGWQPAARWWKQLQSEPSSLALSAPPPLLPRVLTSARGGDDRSNLGSPLIFLPAKTITATVQIHVVCDFEIAASGRKRGRRGGERVLKCSEPSTAAHPCEGCSTVERSLGSMRLSTAPAAL